MATSLFEQFRSLASSPLGVQSKYVLLTREELMATSTVSKKVPPSARKTKKKSAFDAQVFLDSVGASRRVAEFQGKQAIFSQGDPADSVIYVQKGSVKLTVVNESGKEAVVAIFGPGDFFGEGGMAGQTMRWGRGPPTPPTTTLVM